MMIPIKHDMVMSAVIQVRTRVITRVAKEIWRVRNNAEVLIFQFAAAEDEGNTKPVWEEAGQLRRARWRAHGRGHSEVGQQDAVLRHALETGCIVARRAGERSNREVAVPKVVRLLLLWLLLLVVVLLLLVVVVVHGINDDSDKTSW
jgi:hypothetical protein